MADYDNINRSSQMIIKEGNWTLRNSAITVSPGNHNTRCLHAAVTDPDGVGVIDSCFLDGGGVYTHPKYHKGTLIVKNTYISRAPDNGLYAETGTAKYPDNRSHGGTVQVGNCYFRDNNISHVRLNAGSNVQNTVIHNTNSVPSHPNGTNSRGLHTFYGYEPSFGFDTVTASNVHVQVTGGNTNGGNSAFAVSTQGKNGTNPVWQISDSQIQGSVFSRDRFQTSNTGSNPNIIVPDGVPQSAQEALQSSGDGAASLPGGFQGNPPKSAPGGGGGSVTGGGQAPSFKTVDVGLDDIPDNLEPPAAEVTLDAKVDTATWKELNALRDQSEPMDLAVGPFTLSDVGITDLTMNVRGGQSGHDVSITVQEHRTVYVQQPSVDEESDSNEETGDVQEYLRDPSNFEEVPTPDTEQTVNLGDEGLQDGDEIDAYFADHVQSGTRVEIPTGTYTWNGGGLDGTYTDAAIIGGASGTSGSQLLADGGTGRVILDTSGAETPAATIEVPGGGAGSFYLSHVTIAGQRRAGPALIIRVTDEDASALLRRVFLPDGSKTGTATGIRVPESHVGSLYLRNCHVKGFANCGVAAKQAAGSVRVEGGLYRNNNVADLQLGSKDTRAELATVVNDAPGPGYETADGGTQRGLWLAGSGGGQRVIDCDFYHDVGSGTPLAVANGPSIQGAVENSRITNDSDRPAAIIRNDVTFEGVHVTGAGNTTVKGATAACVGPDCDAAVWSTNPSNETVEYDEVVLDEDEVRRVTLDGGDTLSKVVYDQSADGARVELVGDGDGWAIENVAVVGKASGQNQHATITAATPNNGRATIRNVYLADGAAPTSGLTGLRLLAHHAGALTISRVNVQRYPDMGIHTHRPGAPDGGGGTATVDEAYAAHNGRANVTLAGGSTLSNSVVYADGTGPSSDESYRGVWQWYQDASVAASHVYAATAAGPAVVGGQQGGVLSVTDTDVAGDLTGDYTTTNVGRTPTTAVPTVVPDSPTQAAGSE